MMSSHFIALTRKYGENGVPQPKGDTYPDWWFRRYWEVADESAPRPALITRADFYEHSEWVDYRFDLLQAYIHQQFLKARGR